MLFDSLIYFVFLIPVVLAYWQLTYRRQNVFLLFASYFFYGWWDWRFLALMVGSTTMDFLIAGQIQRPSHLLPQVQKRREFDADRFFDGMLLIISGLVRKCVVADNCALLANAAFGGQLGPPNLWVVLIGTYAFAWQVYGDFSGYSDIARGSAQLLGFHFMVNFRQPYLSKRLQEFWRRWHISLSAWLRDYLYIPLGGSEHGKWKTCRNLLITDRKSVV